MISEFSKPTEPTFSFGRVRLPNPGSRNFLLRGAQPTRSAASWKTKTWRMGRGDGSQLRFRNQGTTSQCVRYGNMHMLMLEPIVRFDAFSLTADLYKWAQEHDPWPGAEPEYFGTSVDAGLQFLLHYNDIKPGQKQLIKEYRWALTMDDILTRLTLPASLGGGPVLVGTDFYEEMGGGYGKVGDRNRWIPSGEIWGGHCYVLTGTLAPTAKRTRQITTGNSHDGNYEGIMDADAMEWLIFSQAGEAAAITELPR